MKYLCNILPLIVVATAFSPALEAKEGAGVRGGGHVVEIGGKLELLDLVTKSSFDCMSGQEMTDSNPELAQVLQKISGLDWYFGGELRREIRFIRWCMTGPLYSVPAYDEDSFVRGLKKGIQQAAFRYNDAAYIDESIYHRLSSRSQAMLVLHEVMHSCLAMDDRLKMDHLQMEMNQVLFPRTVSNLDRFRDQVEFIAGREEDRMAAVLASPAPELIIRAPLEQFSSYLASWDRPHDTLVSILTETLSRILSEGTEAEFRLVIEGKTWKKVDSAQIALSLLDQLTEGKRQILFRAEFFPCLFDAGLSYILSAGLSQSAFRILAAPELQELAAGRVEITPVPLTALKPRDATEDRPLPIAIQALENSIALLVRAEEW